MRDVKDVVLIHFLERGLCLCIWQKMKTNFLWQSCSLVKSYNFAEKNWCSSFYQLNVVYTFYIQNWAEKYKFFHDTPIDLYLWIIRYRGYSALTKSTQNWFKGCQRTNSQLCVLYTTFHNLMRARKRGLQFLV